MSQYPHLMNRNGHYYFRIAVPLRLVCKLGKKELTYSLKTKCRNLAKQKVAHFTQEICDLFSRAEHMPVTKDEYEKILATAHANKLVNSPDYLDIVTGRALLDDWSSKTDTSKLELSISQAFQSFLAERKAEKQNTLQQKQSACNLWIELHGDQSITTITPDKVREFKKAVSGLPKNRDKSVKYKGKTAKELLDMNIPEKDKMSVGTRNGYIGTMSTFMGWLQDQYGELKLENHFSGKRFKDKDRKKEKRDPFSEQQLKGLFQTPIYKGCAGSNQFKRYEAGSKIIKDSLYWVPLVALYTGARMEEILRLRPCDIYQQDSVWLFDINENDGKSLKTAKSKRKIPIHPDLVRLGVLDRKQEIEKGKKELVFCDTPKSKQGKYSKEYSKRFGRLLDKYELKTQKTSFHSFRHNFKDSMLNAQISKEIRTALMGHEFGDVHDAVYGGQEIPVKTLAEAISKIKFPFLMIDDGKIAVKT